MEPAVRLCGLQFIDAITGSVRAQKFCPVTTKWLKNKKSIYFLFVFIVVLILTMMMKLVQFMKENWVVALLKMEIVVDIHVNVALKDLNVQKIINVFLLKIMKVKKRKKL